MLNPESHPTSLNTHLPSGACTHIELCNDASTDKEGKSRLIATRMVIMTSSAKLYLHSVFLQEPQSSTRYSLTNPQWSFLKAALSRLCQWRK